MIFIVSLHEHTTVPSQNIKRVKRPRFAFLASKSKPRCHEPEPRTTAESLYNASLLSLFHFLIPDAVALAECGVGAFLGNLQMCIDK